MKISVAQINYHIGNFEGNLHKMKSAISEAREAGSDLVCFSELATIGYPARDFLEFDDFIHLSENILQSLCEESYDLGIIVGAPTRNDHPHGHGKDLFNSACFIFDGKIQYRQHKTLLPTYDVFDEYRYFEPAKSWSCIEFKGLKIAMTVCEDIWDIDIENPLYNMMPMDELIKENPDVMINVSASPFHYNHANARINVVKANVRRYGIPMFYINHCGAQTELIFDGGSLVMAADESYIEMPYFEEKIQHFEFEKVLQGFETVAQKKNKIVQIHDAIVLGIKDYFRKLGFSKAILGLSGGIDSAVTLVLAQRALGSENVRVLAMPSQFSSTHSVDDAVALANTLNVRIDIVKIADIYDSFMAPLQDLFEDRLFNVTEENIQARIRGVLNMAISNKFGNILLNTSNKSEMAVGYGTLYGDLCGGISVLGDVYKTEVFELAKYINSEGEIIPINTIIKPPSAELRPNQKDSDSLPEYDILDQILYLYIEKRTDPQDIIAMGFEENLVKRILKMVNINEFKRYQTPPVLRVSPKAFGMGRRMPIVARYLN